MDEHVAKGTEEEVRSIPVNDLASRRRLLANDHPADLVLLVFQGKGVVGNCEVVVIRGTATQ